MGFVEMAIKRPIFIASIVILSLLGGYVSLRGLPVDLFPDVTLPIVTVQTVYPGASPTDVETLISKVIEEELGSIPGLKKISSQSLEGVSIVICEFRLGTDIKESEQQIRNRVGNIQFKLPDDADEPIFNRIDPADQAVIRLALKSNLPGTRLYDIAKDEIAPLFERVSGVGKVEIIGGRKREIQILVDTDKLQERQLSFQQIVQKVSGASKNVPVGKQDQSLQEVVYRSVGEFTSLESMKKTVISYLGQPVFLSEFSKISDAEEKEKTRSYLKGERALFLDIFKQSGTNTVAVADGVKKNIEKVNQFLKSKGLVAEISIVRDGADRIRANIYDVNEAIIIGIILCVIVVFFFLGNARSTVITGLALPNSLLGAFILMSIMGFSVNIMTLLALSLAVGLLIDDAIVVRENIFRHMELGKNPYEAALVGTKEVTLAVLATSAVVCAVFGPIAFLDGMVGQFFREFGLTVVFAMVISTFDALTVAPTLSAHWASVSHKKSWGPVQWSLDKFEAGQLWLENIYAKTIDFTLNNKILVLVGGTVFFFLCLGLLPFIPKTFLPPQDSGEFIIRLETPVDSSLEYTNKILNKVDQVVREDKNILFTSAVAGDRNGQSNKGEIFIQLVPSKQRNLRTAAVKDLVREKISPFLKEANLRVQDYDAFGGDQRPFMLNVEGQDLEVLSAYVEKVKARLSQIPGLVEVDTNYRMGKPEFQVVFDREKTGSRGILITSAGQELRARVEGVVAGVFRENGREYDIRVMAQEDQRDIKKDYHKIFIPNDVGRPVALKDFAQFKDALGYSQINRQNRSRFISISGDIGTQGSLGFITAEATKIFNSELPPPPGVTWAYQGQAEDFADLMVNMMITMFFAVILIYLVLASLYNSFITPFTILLALPLAICGALIALYITGKSVDIFSMIGIILLLGVVAKNSILLVDYTLKLTDDEGMPRLDALKKACRTRLRPILMTSIALIAGMIPIAIGLNEASRQRTSMGVAVIGGLISSTFLTLLIVPAAYGYIDDFRLWLGRWMKRFNS